MRKNTWVFYFFIIVFTAILSINLVWRFTPIRKEINIKLQERLKPYLGESFALSDFSIGFGYMSFYNITSGSKDDNYQLYLDEIQIGYSIHKLPFNNFDPLRVIESITFKHPHLIVLTDQKDSIQQANTYSLDVTDALTGLQRLAEVDRVLISHGQILWGKNLGDLTKLVSELDGYCIVQPEQIFKLNLTGKLFDSSSRDLSLTGEVNLQDKFWEADAIVERSRIKESIPFLKNKQFFLKSADIKGHLRLSGPSFNMQQLDISGLVQVKNMQAHIFNQKLFANDFDIIFSEQHMNLSPVSGKIEDGQFDLSGDLGEVFKPNLNFDIDFHHFSAKHIAISAPILELLNQGMLEGNIKIYGPTADIKINGKIHSSQIQYSIVPFYNAKLDFTFQNKIWEFHDILTHSIGMDHRGKGQIDFNKMQLRLDIFSYRHIDEHTFPILDKLNNTDMTYQTSVDGDFPTLTFTGNVHNIFFHQKEPLWINNFFFKLVDNYITIQTTNTATEKTRMYAEITDLWNDPAFKIMEISDIPFSRLSQIEAIHWIDKNFNSSFYFSGPVNFPSTKINFFNRKSQEIAFSFGGNLINLIRDGLKFKGNFTLQTIPEKIKGNFNLEEKDKELVLQLNVPRMLDGNLFIGTDEKNNFNGKLKIEEFPVQNYIAQFPTLVSTLKEGNISGNINIKGTTISPEIDFFIRGENFIVNRNGYYSAEIKGKYQKTALTFEDSKIFYNNYPIIDANFNLDLITNSLQAKFRGDKIESNFIAATIFKDSHLIQGNLSYQIDFNGEFNHPKISGIIDMENGNLKKRNFNNLHLEFTDSIPNNSTLFQLKQHIFIISEFNYEDKRDFSINMKGYIPVEANAPFALTVNAHGNILAELPNIIDYFQNPSCSGELSLQVEGTRQNPKIIESQIKIFNGSLEFESVIPELTNLQAEIELVKNTKFIHIKNLQGNIDGRAAKIYNIPKASVEGDTLQPWYFDEFGLNFGILVLQTTPRGIPLSIPGLMNPGDIGFFATKGKQNGEEFYFAGPVERPYVRGKVTLIESRVTFPFLVAEEDFVEGESDKVLDFLMNINWDVIAVAGLGNRYFVDIPAMIGQVYLDLNIDNVSQGLEFTGRLIDESFRVEGSIESTRGRVEYLDMNFRVDRFGAIFNKFELYPEVYGRAYTTVRDSSNFPRDIYLALYTIDPETKQEVARGRWEDFRFKLVSSDPTIGETQENVLAYLGYSFDNLSNKAGDIGVSLTENLLVRPLIRPLERKMERGLRLDYVRLSLHLTSNLFYYGLQSRGKFLPEQSYLGPNLDDRFDPTFMLLQSSEITLGKYLVQNLYLTYSGQLVSVYDETKLGLNHRFGLEYRILQNLLLEFEYDKLFFDSKYYRNNLSQDFRIRLKHSFNF